MSKILLQKCAEERSRADAAEARIFAAESEAEKLRSRLAAAEDARDAALRKAANAYDCHGDPPVCGACVSCLLRDLEAAKAAVKCATAKAADVWFWQGDGKDDPASLTCPVVMEAHTLRDFVDRADRAESRVRELEHPRVGPEDFERLADAAGGAALVEARQKVRELEGVLDSLVMACELPGDHCEREQALAAARAALATKEGR